MFRRRGRYMMSAANGYGEYAPHRVQEARGERGRSAGGSGGGGSRPSREYLVRLRTRDADERASAAIECGQPTRCRHAQRPPRACQQRKVHSAPILQILGTLETRSKPPHAQGERFMDGWQEHAWYMHDPKDYPPAYREAIKEVSIRGRVALGAACLEALCESLGVEDARVRAPIAQFRGNTSVMRLDSMERGAVASHRMGDQDSGGEYRQPR